MEDQAPDARLEQAGPANVALLRACTVFTLPVPGPVIKALARQLGGQPRRLRGLGLLRRCPDPHAPARRAWAPDPLAAERLEPLTAAGWAEAAAASVGPLLAAWGGPAGRRERRLDLQLARLGLHAGDPAVLAACAAPAVAALRDGLAADAFRFGHEAISLLDRHHQRVPLVLLLRTADAALISGDGPQGGALLVRAVRQTETDSHPVDYAQVITAQARYPLTRGDLDQAHQLLQHARTLFTAAGSEREAASATGLIAGVAYRRGDYDEAVRIYRDEELPVYQRLGDTRAAAVAWGSIADIAYQRGDHGEALRIHREVELPACEQLGDPRETALTWGKIAGLACLRGDLDEALRIHREVELPVYERLGDTRAVAGTWGGIADVAYQRGDDGEALRIRLEVQLPVYERLGDIRAVAVTWGKVADIARRRGDLDEVLRIHREMQLPLYERLGDTRSAAIVARKIQETAGP